MSNRLLNDNEIYNILPYLKAGLLAHHVMALKNGREPVSLEVPSDYKQVTEAQDAKTHRIDVEWLKERIYQDVDGAGDYIACFCWKDWQKFVGEE